MYLQTGSPMRGAVLEKMKAFLNGCGLDYDEAVDFSCVLMENDEIIAAGSLDGATIKCVAVSPLHQGEDLTARLLTELRREAFSRGRDSLMLFTKPANESRFRPFGFYPVMRASGCLLMEDKRGGFAQYLDALRSDRCEGINGAIVANCAPFTLGHRYLVEKAAAQCDRLHLFILSENRGMFLPEMRMALAQAGCQDLKNVYLHPTEAYMVSSGTFPSYFIKDKARIGDIHCELDVRIFGEKIAPALNIVRRFVGTEPHCPVTRFYNEQLKARLPKYGVEVIELPRLELDGEAVSASRVRRLLENGDFESLRPLVPETTYEYLIKNYPFGR